MKTAFKDSLPVMAGYLVLGIGFGIFAMTKGLAWYYPVLMSILIYAGSMQYVAVDLISTGAHYLTFILMTLVVNARHLFYGLAMLFKYRDLKKAKAYCIFALTDETFSLVCQNDVEESSYYFFLSLFNQIYWILGTILGCLIGNHFPFNPSGIEFSMTALFFVTMIEQWEKSDHHLPAILGLSITLICLFIFKSNHFLIPSMIGITCCLLLNWRKEDE